MATQAVPKRKAVTFAMRFQVFMHAVLFVLGMSTIIVLFFGGAAAILGGLWGLLFDARDPVARVKQHTAQNRRRSAKQQHDHGRHAQHEQHGVQKNLEAHRKRDGLALGHRLSCHSDCSLR